MGTQRAQCWGKRCRGEARRLGADRHDAALCMECSGFGANIRVRNSNIGDIFSEIEDIFWNVEDIFFDAEVIFLNVGDVFFSVEVIFFDFVDIFFGVEDIF